MASDRFDFFFFCISVYFLLSFFPLYKMNGMVMDVGNMVTVRRVRAGSVLTAAGPGSVWTWCRR